MNKTYNNIASRLLLISILIALISALLHWTVMTRVLIAIYALTLSYVVTTRDLKENIDAWQKGLYTLLMTFVIQALLILLIWILRQPITLMSVIMVNAAIGVIASVLASKMKRNVKKKHDI